MPASNRLHELEGIFDPINVICLQGFEDDTIETTRTVCVARVFEQVDLRGMNDALLFARIDAGSSTAEVVVFAVADFDENQCLAIKRDAVDLAAADAVVTFDHAQAGAFKVCHGQAFRLVADELFAGAHVILEIYSSNTDAHDSNAISGLCFKPTARNVVECGALCGGDADW